MKGGAEESVLNWRVKHIASSCSRVPTSPGVYAIGHDETFYGLETGRTYVYVGRTENLRRRLREHLPGTEQNPALRAYLNERVAEAKCWYATTKRSKLQTSEDELIRQLQPLFNRIGK